MSMTQSRRAALREQVQRWLNEHRDPRDPLTQPVELLLEMYLTATSWCATVMAVFAGSLLTVMIVAGIEWTAAQRSANRIEVPAGERDAMQQWVTSREASRLMRCEAGGLVFESGRCRSTDAGWLIPLAAQERLVSLGPVGSEQPDAGGAAGKGTNKFRNPFE